MPAGYFVVRPSTYGNWMPFRSFLVDGSTRPGVESVKKYLKIYQLADAANPPPVKFVNASGIPSNFVFPTDYSFWGLLNHVIQEEPSEGSDPTTLGLFASIGIVKGQPFNPDARMEKILEDAAAYAKGGKPEASDVDIEGTEKVTPMIIDDCNPPRGRERGGARVLRIGVVPPSVASRSY